MPLNWRINEIKNFNDVCYEEREPSPSSGSRAKKVTALKLRTEQLIFATMVVGMNHISEKNHLEFWYRLHLYESMFGTFRLDEDGDWLFYLLPDVKDHIGLHTNATIVPFGKWSRRVKETYLERIQE